MKNRYFFIFISAFIFYSILNTNNAASQYVIGSQTVASGSNQIDLTISVDSSENLIKFVLTGPSTKWFGVSFNTTIMSP